MQLFDFGQPGLDGSVMVLMADKGCVARIHGIALKSSVGRQEMNLPAEDGNQIW